MDHLCKTMNGVGSSSTLSLPTPRRSAEGMPPTPLVPWEHSDEAEPASHGNDRRGTQSVPQRGRPRQWRIRQSQ